MNVNLTKVFAAFLTLIFVQAVVTKAQDTGSESKFYGIPAGTLIRVKMDTEINSASAEKGDTFTVTVTEPVEVKGIVVLPSDTTIEGRVLDVKRAAAGRRDGRLTVSFETLFLDLEDTRTIEGTIEREPRKKDRTITDLLAVFGGTAAGGLIGAVTGVRNGALIGAGIGAAAGTGATVLREGDIDRIKTDEEFGVRIEKAVPLPAKGW